MRSPFGSGGLFSDTGASGDDRNEVGGSDPAAARREVARRTTTTAAAAIGTPSSRVPCYRDGFDVPNPSADKEY